MSRPPKYAKRHVRSTYRRRLDSWPRDDHDSSIIRPVTERYAYGAPRLPHRSHRFYARSVDSCSNRVVLLLGQFLARRGRVHAESCLPRLLRQIPST